MIPSVSNRWSSFSTFSRKAYGTGRALQNLGVASGCLGITLLQYLWLFPVPVGTGSRALPALPLESDIFECNGWTTPSNSIGCVSANPFPVGLDLIFVQRVSVEQPVVPRTLPLR